MLRPLMIVKEKDEKDAKQGARSQRPDQSDEDVTSHGSQQHMIAQWARGLDVPVETDGHQVYLRDEVKCGGGAVYKDTQSRFPGDGREAQGGDGQDTHHEVCEGLGGDQQIGGGA